MLESTSLIAVLLEVLSRLVTQQSNRAVALDMTWRLRTGGGAA